MKRFAHGVLPQDGAGHFGVNVIGAAGKREIGVLRGLARNSLQTAQDGQRIKALQGQRRGDVRRMRIVVPGELFTQGKRGKRPPASAVGLRK